MILNKSSYERGFGHASMYKTMQVDLAEEAGRDGKSSSADGNRMVFSNKTNRSGELWHPSLGEDGLPEVGSWVYEGDPLYCVVSPVPGVVVVDRLYKSHLCSFTVALSLT